MGVLASEMKGHGCEDYHFHPLRAEVKNTSSYTSAVLQSAAITISLHACFTCNVVSLGSKPNCVSVKCVNKCPTRCNYKQFILSVNCSTYFGWFLHPSSGAQITVSTASGTSQPLLLPVAIVEELGLQSATGSISTRCCRYSYLCS